MTFCALSVLALRPSTRVDIDMSSLTVLFICDLFISSYR